MYLAGSDRREKAAMQKTIDYDIIAGAKANTTSEQNRISGAAGPYPLQFFLFALFCLLVFVVLTVW